MSTRKKPLSQDEIRKAVAELAKPVISPEQLAGLLGHGVKTVYDWIAKGRLDGAFRKRGKHHLIWRDRALALIFNGPEWNSDE